MTAPKVTLRIDRIVTDQAGLTREALVAAIQREIANGRIAAMTTGQGTDLNIATRSGRVLPGKSDLSTRVAQATITTITGGR